MYWVIDAMKSWNLTCHTLDLLPYGPAVQRVLTAALDAVEPAAAVRRSLLRAGDQLSAGDRVYDLRSIQRVLLVGIGKAAVPMSQAAAEILGERLAAGVVVTKRGHSTPEGGPRSPSRLDERLLLLEAGHPLPDVGSVEAAVRVRLLLQGATSNDLVLCLISGGGSAILASPAPGLSLEDLQSMTAVLLACGASIDEINALRKHLDEVKGGGLARWAAPAQVLSLILSDVVGDPLDVIASGPTVPDRTSFGDALAVLDRYGIASQIPRPVLDHVRRGVQGEVRETPKPGEMLSERVQNTLIGSNALAARAAVEQARGEGWQGLLLTTFLQGEARQAGRFIGALARQLAATGDPLPPPTCLVAGGETTVTLHGEGLGGRNQELALGAVADLDGLADVLLITLATDGGDGPTDAAGAVVSGDTMQRARAADLNPAHFLARNDAYHFFEPLGDLLRPGTTQTNVNDLIFLIAGDPALNSFEKR